MINTNNLQGGGQHYERLEITGEERYVVIDNVNHIRYHRAEGGRLWQQRPELLLDQDVVEWQPNYTIPNNQHNTFFTNGYAYELQHFASAILDGEQPSPDIYDGLQAIKIAHRVKQSADEGRTVKIG